MTTPTIDTLAVPGADLYYEVRGAGPAILMIATGNGDATPFWPLADALADRYTVITYDRRGYSRSPLTAPLEDRDRLDAEVDDARRLLDELVGAPAHVFGTCSGGIVALALLERYPEHIQTLVVHEPPLVSVLPDAGRWLKFHNELYDMYKESGLEAARNAFRAYAGMDGDTRPPPEFILPPDQLEQLRSRLHRNQVVWFEHELLTFPAVLPDVATLGPLSNRLVLAGGSSSRDHHSCQPTRVLAEQLGIGIAEFPGGHVGHVTDPLEFAGTLAGWLAAGAGPRGGRES